jgi:hypothetical protein
MVHLPRMRFEFVNDDTEIKRNEFCVDYGKLRNLPGEENLALLFVQIFAENVIFFASNNFREKHKIKFYSPPKFIRNESVCQLCQAAELAKSFSGLLCFVQIFDENVNLLQAITFAKSTRSLMVPVSHQWCEHFYRLLYSSTRHTERWKEEKETLN